MSGRLGGGEAVLFRPVRPADKAEFVRGLQLLSRRSRYARFSNANYEFDERTLRYLTEVDFRDHVALAAELPEEAGTPLLAVGRWIRRRAQPEQAEAAVAVLDAYQGRGLGTALFRLLVETAVERGVRVLTAQVLADNRALLDYLHRLGASTATGFEGVVEVRVPLPGDTRELALYPRAELLLTGSKDGA